MQGWALTQGFLLQTDQKRSTKAFIRWGPALLSLAMAASLPSEALSDAITPFLLNRSEVTWAPGAVTTGSSFKTLTVGAAVPLGGVKCT